MVEQGQNNPDPVPDPQKTPAMPADTKRRASFWDGYWKAVGAAVGGAAITLFVLLWGAAKNWWVIFVTSVNEETVAGILAEKQEFQERVREKMPLPPVETVVAWPSDADLPISGSAPPRPKPKSAA